MSVSNIKKYLLREYWEKFIFNSLINYLYFYKNCLIKRIVLV